MGLITPTTRDKIYYYLFMALAFCLPVHGRLIPPVILLIGINWLLEFNFKEKIVRIKKSKTRQWILSFGVFYLVYVIGTLYSSQLNGPTGAFFNLEVKLSLFVFPLLFATIDFTALSEKLFKKVLYAFVLGCLAGGLLLINNAFFQFFNLGSSEVFFYKNLSDSHHPGYLALYFTFAIILLLDWILKNENVNNLKRNLAIFLIINFQVFIVLLSSKAGILGLFLAYVLVPVFYFISDRKRKKRSIIITAILIVTFSITNILSPQTYQRFFAAGKTIDNSQAEEAEKDQGSVARLLVWKSSLEVIKENLVFGVGTGDVTKTLLEKYKEENVNIALEESLNAHNQYLQTYIATGITGFIILLLCFIIPAVYAIKGKQLIYFIFLVIFAFHMLVESMLERQAGVVFYAFFNAILFYYSNNNRT